MNVTAGVTRLLSSIRQESLSNAKIVDLSRRAWRQCSLAVERLLRKQKVAGSIPVVGYLMRPTFSPVEVGAAAVLAHFRSAL
jgi:hypothetical protein